MKDRKRGIAKSIRIFTSSVSAILFYAHIFMGRFDQANKEYDT